MASASQYNAINRDVDAMHGHANGIPGSAPDPFESLSTATRPAAHCHITKASGRLRLECLPARTSPSDAGSGRARRAYDSSVLVGDAMTRRAETIGPGDTLQVAALKMKQLDVGALVVCEGADLVGIITDRDIVVRAVADGRNPAEVEVRSAMTPQVLDCCEDDGLEGAATSMARGAVRRLVVLDASKRLVGMLSVDDVALHSPELAGEIVEHVRAPERPIRREPWPWWETPES